MVGCGNYVATPPAEPLTHSRMDAVLSCCSSQILALSSTSDLTINCLSLDGFSLLCKPENELRVSITMKQQFLNYSDQPVWHQEACKTQSCLNPSVFSPHYSAAQLENVVFKLPCPSLCPCWIEMLGMLLKKILKLISSWTDDQMKWLVKIHDAFSRTDD